MYHMLSLAEKKNWVSKWDIKRNSVIPVFEILLSRLQKSKDIL